MLLLEKYKSNTNILRVKWRSNIQSPYYTFILTDKWKGNSYSVISVDISDNCCAYNEFLINLDMGTASGIDGNLNNLFPGEYKYELYENSVKDLNISNANLLTYGNCLITGTISINDVYL